MKVVLIPCATTEWHEAGRLLGRVELPLTPEGEQQCDAWIEQLRAYGIECLYHAPDELATRTAELLAERLNVRTRPLEALAEVDIGLWTGLTEAQLKRRFGSAHRELREAPLHVNPPGGEAIADATERLKECVCKQVRKNGRTAIGVITRPLGLALLQCALNGQDFSAVWELARGEAAPVVLECDPSTGRTNGKA
jgi:broad specificity phosphatase PhoE